MPKLYIERRGHVPQGTVRTTGETLGPECDATKTVDKEQDLERDSTRLPYARIRSSVVPRFGHRLSAKIHTNTITESRVTIMLNVDKLSSSHKENCFIQEAVIIIKWII
ncbi:hypothetical protein ALC57_06148 [Trachymyrmex cornetzi]|uniref:Uncharacterized protein n=1 Tax=Trachymyrmex cornetzi TaxID=471704 RepID=A0A195E9P1_9HYME|nr:hypothetical protein ALC57_06148 [Trachymyrmex cornetzi]